MNRREYLTNIGKIRSDGSIRHTFTSTFLLPTIGYCEKEFGKRLINVYIDENFQDPTLYLIIDYDIHVEKSLERLQKNTIYIEHSFSEDKSEIIIKFKIPEVYHSIFNKFINGKYSEFDNNYKQILIDMYTKKVNPNGSFVTVCDTIYPRKEKRKQIANELNVDINIVPEEVFDPPELNYEIYKSLEQLNNQNSNKLVPYGGEESKC